MLAVDADLRLACGREAIRVAAAGSEIVVDFSSFALAFAVARRARTWLPLARRAADALAASGLTLVVGRGDVNLVRFGAGVDRDLVGRVLGISHLRVLRGYRRP